MKEYEYSIIVDSLDKYIDYCEKNNYILSEKIYQTRIIYRKNDNTMARITINKFGDNEYKVLDFKEDKLSYDVLIERKESEPLAFENEKAIISILSFLGYKKDNTLKRNRYVYDKDDVKFELDEYIEPNDNKVISLEGNKSKVDKIWSEISNL